jgi:hypothetical protein
MRRLLLVLLCLSAAAFPQSISIGGSGSVSGTVTFNGSGSGGVTGCGAGYSGVKSLVLNRAIGSNLSNFAYDVTFTYPSLRTVPNSGSIQNTATNPRGLTGQLADFIICDAATGGSAVKFYVSSYDATTGKIRLKIGQATLHSGSNDVLWMFYNKSSITTSQQDYSLLADSSLVEDCSFPDGSTLNPNCDVLDGTTHGSSIGATTGQVDGGLSLNSTNGDYLDLSGPANTGTNMSELIWVNPSPWVGAIVVNGNVDSGPTNGFLVGINNSGTWGAEIHGSGVTHSVVSSNLLNAGSMIHLALTNDGSTLRTFENAVADSTGTGGSISSSAQNMTFGKRVSGSPNYGGIIDEMQLFSKTLSADEIANYYLLSAFNNLGFIDDPSGVNPVRSQSTSCAAADASGSTSAICTLPTQVASGDVIVTVAFEIAPIDCTVTPTSQLGLTYTRQVTNNFSGTLQHYYGCIYTATATGTGTEVITLPPGNGSAVVYVLKNATTTGIVTTSTGTAGPPSTMTATSPGANSFLICGTKGGTGNSDGRSEVSSPSVLNIAHPSETYTEYGLVGTGSQSCSMTGSTSAVGLMIMIPKA